MYLALLLFVAADCSKILVINPSPNYSYTTFSKRIYLELSERGHEVVVFTGFPTNRTFGKLQEHEINVTSTAFDFFWRPTWAQTYSYIAEAEFFVQTCRNVLEHPHFKTSIRERFDVVLAEIEFAHCFEPLLRHLRLPVIWLSPFYFLPNGLEFTGNPIYATHMSTHAKLDHELFWDRWRNALFQVAFRLYYRWVVLPKSGRLVLEHFGVVDVEFRRSGGVVLINSNHLLFEARPFGPAIVECGMLHVGFNRPPLETKLKDYLDNSGNGFILFSMGSIISDHSVFPNATLQMILEVFRGLPYNVIWKARGISGLPGNVKMLPWIPQETVLAHPNIRLFITHGGLMSVQEAVHYAVPMLSIPVIFDQHYFARRIAKLNIGRKLELAELDAEVFQEAIVSVIEGRSYRENMQAFSRLAKDQLVKPLEKALWWIEYVLKHRGAPHLQTGVLEMGWIEEQNFDVLLVLVAALWVIALCFWKLWKLLAIV